MKAIVMSDSHLNFQSIIDIVSAESDADLIIHAGDMQRDVDDIEDAYPQYRLVSVVGNNDYFVQGAYDRIFNECGKTIFLTHGHKYSVKRSRADLRRKAKDIGADICIFGHTHQSLLEEIDGVLYLNPGSTRNSYAILKIEGGKASAEIKGR